MKTTSKDKYQGRLPRESERKKSELIASILSPFMAYGIIILFSMIAFSGNSSKDQIGFGILLGLTGGVFVYGGIKGIINKDHVWQSCYGFIWGIIGLLPILSHLTGLF